MSNNEANAIIDSISDNNKTDWEKVRWLGYITALTQGAKLKDPKELIKFNWEQSDDEAIEPKDNRTIDEVRNNLMSILNSL